MIKAKSLLALSAAALLAACSSQPSQNESTDNRAKLPGWVLNPVQENGLADTQCVNNVGDMNILKNKATALARAEIAKQINIKVKAMDKTYQNMTETANGESIGSTFEAVSKQVTEQALSGTRPVKVDYVDFPDGTLKLCAMVSLEPEATKNLFDNIVTQSGRALSPQSNEILYQEFKAYKAQQELEAELSGN